MGRKALNPVRDSQSCWVLPYQHQSRWDHCRGSPRSMKDTHVNGDKCCTCPNYQTTSEMVLQCFFANTTVGPCWLRAPYHSLHACVHARLQPSGQPASLPACLPACLRACLSASHTTARLGQRPARLSLLSIQTTPTLKLRPPCVGPSNRGGGIPTVNSHSEGWRYATFMNCPTAPIRGPTATGSNSIITSASSIEASRTSSQSSSILYNSACTKPLVNQPGKCTSRIG